jgi:hypothetical protein
MREVIGNLCHLMKHVRSIPEEGFRELVSKILVPLGSPGWELGPNPEDADHLTLSISSNGHQARLAAIAKNLNLPVKHKDWSIVAGIPPRDWHRYFEIIRDDGRRMKVDADNWFWRANRNGGSVILDIAVPQSLRLNAELLHEAVVIFLNGELGEVNFAKRVIVGIVSRFGDKPPHGYLGTNELRRHFLRWFPRAAYRRFLGNRRARD